MLKNLSPAVTVESTWEDVKVRSASTPEYHALESDEKRKEIFDRYIERLKVRKKYTLDITVKIRLYVNIRLTMCI